MTTVPVQYSFPIDKEDHLDEMKAFILENVHPLNIMTFLAMFEREASNDLTSALFALEMIRHTFLEQFATDTIAFHKAFHAYCQLLIRTQYQYYLIMMRNAIRVATQYYPLMHGGFRASLHLHGTQSVAYVRDRMEKDVRMRWRAIKFAVILLGLHSRAVVTANHPNRKRDRKEFMCT